ncbi:AAA family ATPase [Deltaproteobacteria bacterium TL4]
MISLKGYKVSAQPGEGPLYEGANTVVYRGLREDDGQPVILKMLKKEYPTQEELTQFKREYDITRNFDFAGVIKTYGLEKYQNTLVLILEDFNGKSLRDSLKEKALDLESFLKVAIRVVDILGHIHQRNIIHKDINPANIIWDPESSQVRIIDFGISTALSREKPEIRNPNVLEGTLAYMSPEQTGRMNRAIDYRTDLYSLGVTFYEMLTRQLPFQTDDPMELVHCHIAKIPTAPHEINAGIPQVISRMIMKLLSKTAEERYQSAFGLKIDFQDCREQLIRTGKIENFEIAQQDISGKFQIPQKLYGREKEIEILLEAFDRVCSGSKELILVAGYSGIGKTAVIHEIHKPIVRKRGYFISGKFDQLKRNIPYASLIQAFQELIEQLLMESEAKITFWRQRLLDALGINGRVIIDVIPEVELLIGKQPPAAPLPPEETQNRFNLIFLNFVRVFAMENSPLVIFLDDLQWVDSSSLKMLSLLLSSPEEKFLFLIGAYRDNEVDPAHPLMNTLKELRKAELPISTINLKPLGATHVNQLVSDTLMCDSAVAQPLADLCLQKTSGNPFFLSQLLQVLYEDQFIEFDGHKGAWQWDIERIRQVGMTDNVVELMVAKIKKLPEKTQAVLKLAACLGTPFELKMLSIVNEKSIKETADELWESLSEGLVLPTDDAYKFLDESEDNPNISHVFLHDRVQQAAYTMIEEEQKKAVHLKVGRLMLEKIPENQRDEKIFDIVNHLNRGSELMQEHSERLRLTELNLKAGRKAKISAAFDPAYQYLKNGLELLDDTCWKAHYELTVALYTEAVETAYLNTDFEKMEHLASVILKQAKTQEDKIIIRKLRVQSLFAQNKIKESLKEGLAILKILGFSIAENTNDLHVAWELVKTKLLLSRKNIVDFSQIKDMTDPKILTALHAMSLAGRAAYSVNSNLLAVLLLHYVRLSLNYGIGPESPFGFAGLGMITSGALGQMESGYHYGELALKINDRPNTRKYRGRTLFLKESMLTHLKHNLRETLQPFLEAYQLGLESGDIEYAALSAHLYCSYAFFSGKALEEQANELTVYCNAIQHYKQQISLNYNNMFRQTVSNLLGENTEPYRLEGEAYSEEKMLPIHQETNEETAIFDLFFLKMFLCYLFERYEEAAQHAVMVKKRLDNVVGLYYVPAFYFLDSLVSLAIAGKLPRKQQTPYLRRVRSNQRKLKRWVKSGPMNYLHKYDLVAAEIARVLGQGSEAMFLYKKAIEGAKTHEFTQEEALANELLAKFYLSNEQDKAAKAYMQEALYLYKKWGATAKINDLETRYPGLHLEQKQATSVGVKTTATLSGTTKRESESMDLASVMKVSQAISSEIVLEKLLDSLIKIAIENAGAEKGFLILEKGGAWRIEVQGRTQNKIVTEQKSILIESTEELSAAIVLYVIRTKENVVLNDASHEGKFTSDAYVLKRQPKSILCAPIIYQNKIKGILYLENDLTTGAFTPDRMKVLNILSSQAAISMENAMLYASQANNVRREEELKTAAAVQHALFPKELPQNDQLELASFFQSASETGGDWYGFISKIENTFFILVGDVTGHGVPAALVTATASATCRMLENLYWKYSAYDRNKRYLTPASTLEYLNKAVYQAGVQKYLMTFFVVAIDLNTKIMTYANAGHNFPLILKENTKVKKLLSRGNRLGEDPESTYTEQEIQLEKGDLLFFFTDGLTENRNPQGEEWGEKRLGHYLKQHRQKPLQAIIDGLVEEMWKFNDGAPLEDDVTMVSCKIMA